MAEITHDPKGINRRIKVTDLDSLAGRFWKRVDKTGDCWLWTAAQRNGYGAIKHQGKVLQAHRVAYLLTHGETDQIIGHKCDNKLCCNPDHLEAITPGQNNRDARGRLKFNIVNGEDCHNSKLTEEDVANIWAERKTGSGAVRISRKLNLGQSLVKHVIQKQTWKHLIPDWAK